MKVPVSPPSGSVEQLGGLCRPRRDPRRTPLVHSSDDLDSLLSQDEEDEADVRRAQVGPSCHPGVTQHPPELGRGTGTP